MTTDEWEQAYDRIFNKDEPPQDTGNPPDTSGTPTDGTPQQQEARPPPDTGTPPDTSGTPSDGAPQQQETGPPPDTGGGQNAANTGTVTALEGQLAAAAKMAMMQSAMKLYTGIGGAPLAADGDGARTAAYDTDGNIEVTIGTATPPPDTSETPSGGAPQQQEATAVDLTVDKDATVAALHGWTGKKYTASPDGGGTYEAVVYSNVGDPTQGEKFNVEYTLTATDADNPGETATLDTSTAAVQARIASSSFDQSAGKKEFTLPTNTVRVMLAGMYHGVSGTYYCAPTDANTMCSSTVAAKGFTLAGGTWTFKPTDPNVRVTSVEDTDYASYGWWLHKPAEGNWVASAFVDDMGNVPAASGIDALRGTAMYMGGAAGKYALHSATGGTNDAGHFTARATLEADFNTDMVTGTIDNFMGADGQSRDWSVALKTSGVSDTGQILGADGADGSDPMKTVWTIDGTAAPESGQWSGMLRDNGDDGVPKVATGTFHSEYDNTGRMVGAFGANTKTAPASTLRAE